VAARTGTETPYASALGELWTDLARTLSRLDQVAAEPDRLDRDGVDASLHRLQYALHSACEQIYGLVPPEGERTAHSELAHALAAARDATGEVAEAVEAWGAEGANELLHEWRGALFRVRLARLRLDAHDTRRQPGGEPPEKIGRPLLAFLLALTGAVAFAGGVAAGAWPIWAAGIVAVALAVLVYRP
jgi:hypothetical protein